MCVRAAGEVLTDVGARRVVVRGADGGGGGGGGARGPPSHAPPHAAPPRPVSSVSPRGSVTRRRSGTSRPLYLRVKLFLTIP